MTKLLNSGFTDSFRYLYPTKREFTVGGVIASMPERTMPDGVLTTLSHQTLSKTK